MRVRSGLLTLTVGVVLGVACSPEPRQASPPPAPKAAPAPPPAPPAPVSADALPPRQKVEADGITLTEFVDGRVRVQSTFLWNEALDATYDNCDFYRGALPVLERQLAPERAKHLAEMCVVAPPPPKDAKAARRAKTAKSMTAKPPKVVQAP